MRKRLYMLGRPPGPRSPDGPFPYVYFPRQISVLLFVISGMPLSTVTDIWPPDFGLTAHLLGPIMT